MSSIKPQRNGVINAVPANVPKATGDPNVDTPILLGALSTPGRKNLSGAYVTNAPIPIIGYLHLVGDELVETKITNTTGDIFTVSGDVYYFMAEELGLIGSNGHIFNVGTTASLQSPILRHCLLEQAGASYSIWSQIGPNTGSLIGLLVEDCVQIANPATTVPPWNIIGNVGGTNGNNWVRGSFNSTSASVFANVPFVHVEEQAAGAYCADNHIKNVVAELCAAGLATFLGASHCSVEETGSYDVTNYSATLVTFGQSAVNPHHSVWCKVVDSGRRGGALGAGAYDVDISGAVYSRLEEAGPESGSPSYNLPAQTNGYTIIENGITIPYPWIPLPYVNSWTDVTGYKPGGYRLTNDGQHVEIVGDIKGGTAVTVCTLPAGFRPPTTTYYTAQNESGGGVTYVQIVGATGAVNVGVSGGAVQLGLGTILAPLDS